MAGMYSERLIVRNFGPITNLDIEFRRLTLFIGDQGSGKSTLSKLLTICRDMRWWLQLLEDSGSEGIKKPFSDFGIIEYFMEDTYINYSMGGLDIKYEKLVQRRSDMVLAVLSEGQYLLCFVHQKYPSPLLMLSDSIYE